MPKKHSINLLPPRIQQQRHRRQLFLAFAVAQVVVFLLLGGAFFIMRRQENQLREHSQSLAAQINAIDRSAADTPVEPTQDTTESIYLAWARVEEGFAPGFDPLWLQQVLDAVPSGITLSSMDFDGTYINITALADDFGAIAAHQQLLNEANWLEAVHLGATQRQQDGQARFTLRLLPLHE